jgi:molybdate transport system permease protein
VPASQCQTHEHASMNLFPALSPEDWQAVHLSLLVASIATLASLPFGILIAHLLARKSFPGKALLDGLVHLPLVLPPVVTGYGLLLLFGKQGPLGRALEQVFGISLSFRWTGAALAAAVMAFPLMVRAIRIGFEAVDRRNEQAAATLGAPPIMVFLTVSLPLALPGLLAGIVLAFAKALGEFGATITFVSNIAGETRTIPAAIYTYTQVPGGDGAALQLSIIAALIALTALILSEWLARRARLGIAA